MIHILPYEHLTATFFQNHKHSVSKDYLKTLKNKSFMFFPSARHAITAVLNSLRLEPNDEIYLTNTTKQTYISACVTCTIFNFCKPSRVLSDKTKAIFIIHENGVPYPDLNCLLEEGRNREIPVIEDCAHTFDSKVGELNVGTIGDYGVFSLPKIFPMKTGGILIGNELPDFELKHYEKEIVPVVEKEFRTYGPHLNFFSNRRKENFKALRDLFACLNVQFLFELENNITPVFFGVYLKEAWRIRRCCKEILWGSTMRDDLLLIPTNPMVDSRELVRVVELIINRYVKKNS